MKILINSVLIVLFVSCGKVDFKKLTEFNKQDIIATQSQVAQELPYAYKFSGTDCTTNLQENSTLNGICESLKNDELNNNCAEDKREEIFVKESCPGSFS